MKGLKFISFIFLGLLVGGNAFAGDIFTAMQFDGLARKIKDIYAPEMKYYLKKDLDISINYEFHFKNAAIKLDKDTYRIIVTAPLLDEIMQMPDAATLILCHEVGHVLGGGPFKRKEVGPNDPPLPWASAEGQADYFATAKCAKRVFAEDDNREIVRHFKLSQEVKDKCSEVYGSDGEYFLCLRVAKAVTELSYYMIKTSSRKVSLTTPDLSRVTKTSVDYPTDQCRVDTMFQGALCDADPEEMPNRYNQKTGYCNKSDGYTIGTRPSCWYK